MRAGSGWLRAAKDWARALRRDVLALWHAARDARTPLAAKIAAGVVAAYALSPVDLIPDFVPVLGYLDDLLILPLGIMLAVRLIPEVLMMEFRARAARKNPQVRSRVALVAIILIWCTTAAATGYLIWRNGFLR